MICSLKLGVRKMDQKRKLFWQYLIIIIITLAVFIITNAINDDIMSSVFAVILTVALVVIFVALDKPTDTNVALTTLVTICVATLAIALAVALYESDCTKKNDLNNEFTFGYIHNHHRFDVILHPYALA
jgi:predicted PurR-regulated permease PerM